MVMLGTLATALVAALNAGKDVIGINAAEFAERGKMQTLSGPACLVWLQPGECYSAHSGEPYLLQVLITVFCISGPKTAQEAAMNEALAIALAVAQTLPGSTIGGAYIESPSDNAPVIELLESSSGVAVAGVNLSTSLDLT